MSKNKSSKRKEINAILYQLISSSYVLEYLRSITLKKQIDNEIILITMEIREKNE